MKPRRFGLLLVVLVLLGLPGAPTAQRSSATEVNDAEFAKRVREWTTKPEFYNDLPVGSPKPQTNDPQ